MSAPAGALAFAGLYALGGAAGIPLGTVATVVVAAHLVVRGLLATRPDLVRGATRAGHVTPAAGPGRPSRRATEPAEPPAAPAVPGANTAG